MKAQSFSAPGKAVICGEYAVLRGAPAVSMAVDRRAVVTTQPADGDDFTVTTPGYADGRWRFRTGERSVLRWRDELPADGLAVVETVFGALKASPGNALGIDVDTRGFSDNVTGQKLGLGSSAAATVALAAALMPGAPARDVFECARAAHHRLQGGGSGVDIATACCGGVISYRKDQSFPPQTVVWPDAVHYRFFYSGRPSRTADAIRRAEARDERRWAALDSAAKEADEAIRAGRADGLVAAVSAWTAALRRFDEAGSIGIFAGGHAQMTELAAEWGVVYKPCGAGGGDIGIALAADIADIKRFCRRARGAGFTPLDIRRDDRGVTQHTGVRG